MFMIKKEKKVRICRQGNPDNSNVIYLGRFLSWEEVNDYFKECQVESK